MAEVNIVYLSTDSGQKRLPDETAPKRAVLSLVRDDDHEQILRLLDRMGTPSGSSSGAADAGSPASADDRKLVCQPLSHEGSTVLVVAETLDGLRSLLLDLHRERRVKERRVKERLVKERRVKESKAKSRSRRGDPAFSPRDVRNLGDFQQTMNAFRRRFVQDALDKNGWNVAKTARMLNIARSHLYNLMNHHGLHRGSGST